MEKKRVYVKWRDSSYDPAGWYNIGDYVEQLVVVECYGFLVFENEKFINVAQNHIAETFSE
jgi:hypothetical protein